MTFDESEMGLLLKAMRYSAHQHREQRRKGVDETPYVNHPVEVAEMLWRVGGVREVPVLVAALLHDTVEDTESTPDDIEREFGPVVRALVDEVTDDKSLPKARRKELQVEHAPHKSAGAKLVKLGDKTANVRDVGLTPPPDWSLERRREYLDWAERVVAGLRGANPALEAHFDDVVAEARRRLEARAGES